MGDRKKGVDANEKFISKAREVFSKFDKEGQGEVDAWIIKDALKEMGHNVSDEMIFDMIKVGEVEHSMVTFDRFLQVGGKMDLSGEVDANSLKKLFDLFELETTVDELIPSPTQDSSPADSMIDYSEFCSLLESHDDYGDGVDRAARRSIITPDMRRPFEDHFPKQKDAKAEERSEFTDALLMLETNPKKTRKGGKRI